MYQNRFRRTDPLDLLIVGVDDGAFSSRKEGGVRALLVAVLCQRSRIEAIRIGTIEVDGTDARDILKRMLRRLRFDLVMLSGITFGGFNLIDIRALARDLHRPVIAISGERPNNQAVRKALRDHFADWEERWRSVLSAGRLHSCKPLHSEPRIHFEVKGMTPNIAKRIITGTAVISRLPEPIRIAGRVAKGLSPLYQG
jgi:hypothetical protein